MNKLISNKIKDYLKKTLIVKKTLGDKMFDNNEDSFLVIFF